LLEQKVAQFIAETGDPHGAVPLVVDALAVLERHYGPSSAMELYYKALAIVERTFGSNHPTVGLYIKTIGKTFFFLMLSRHFFLIKLSSGCIQETSGV